MKLHSDVLGRKVKASAIVRDMIKQTRRLRTIGQRTRNPRDKTNWNLAIKLCSEMLEREREE